MRRELLLRQTVAAQDEIEQILRTVYDDLVSSARAILVLGAFNTGLDAVDMHGPTRAARASATCAFASATSVFALSALIRAFNAAVAVVAACCAAAA